MEKLTLYDNNNGTSGIFMYTNMLFFSARICKTNLISITVYLCIIFVHEKQNWKMMHEIKIRSIS